MIRKSWLTAFAAASVVCGAAADASAQNSFGQPGQPYTQQPYSPPQQPYPQQGQSGYPQQQGQPPQGYGNQPYPGGGMQQGMPQQGMPHQGMPHQGMPQQGVPQGMPQQGMPHQRMPQPMPGGPGGMQQGFPGQRGPNTGGGPGGPGYGTPPQGPGYGQGPGARSGDGLDQLARMERQDFGVRPTSRLHQGPMHGPTPASIPGGQIITTKGLVELLQRRDQRVLILDVLGGSERIPGAQNAVPAHQAGSFNDGTQRQFGQYLQQATRGNKQQPIVLYCASPQCWMSYNAALRAIKMGYKRVLWYRGGIDFWKRAGQRVQSNR